MYIILHKEGLITIRKSFGGYARSSASRDYHDLSIKLLGHLLPISLNEFKKMRVYQPYVINDMYNG